MTITPDRPSSLLCFSIYVCHKQEVEETIIKELKEQMESKRLKHEEEMQVLRLQMEVGLPCMCTSWAGGDWVWLVMTSEDLVITR